MERFAFPNFDKAFRDGERIGDRTVRLAEVGPLVLPTGRIVACDPMYLFIRPEPAYTRAVPPGRYPVVLSRLACGDRQHPDERVACAALRFTDARVERWEMALRPGWDLRKLRPGYHFGYGVDGGTGCFVDELAVARLAPAQEQYGAAIQELGSSGKWSLEASLAAMPSVFRMIFTGRRDGPLVIDPDTGANIVTFPSGWGDGSYASYFGLAGDGTPACLVTNFGLLVESVTAELELPVPVREHSELTHPDLALAGIECIRVDWEPTTGQVTIQVGEAPYLVGFRFENRPGQGLGGATSGSTSWYDLDEPLQPTARVVVEYTVRTEAL